jgi:Glycosyltransferase family 87
MRRARLGGFLLFLLGSALFLAVGGIKEHITRSMSDFKCYYFAGRCLLQHCDPYRRDELQGFYLAEGGERSLVAIVSVYVNSPTAFILTCPFALLSWGPAHVLWMIATAGSMIFAAFLIWKDGADYAPLITGGLICFLLATSVWLLMVGNAAGIAVGLCVAAVWCLVSEQLVPVGILCLAISLVIKPHDAGLIWLYFLLAGKVYRKRALQTLLLTIVLCLPGILWVSHLDPNWMQELHSNLVTTSARGSGDDPGPTSPVGYFADTVVDLQTVVSVFRDDPHFYNPVTYLVCGPLVLLWVFTTLRARPSPAGTWLALAAIAALSMLPLYHRQHDTRLLLLTIPACAMLWAEGGLIGCLAVVLNAAGVVLSGDISSAIRIILIRNVLASTTGVPFKILTVVLGRPIPIILLIMGIFYLWVYMRRTFGRSAPTDA